jgi:hypothetical protein
MEPRCLSYLSPQHLVADTYGFDRKIGEGGLGYVYLGTASSLLALPSVT